MSQPTASVDPEGVRVELDKILRDQGFRAARQRSEILRYLVEAELAGAGRDLTEESIAGAIAPDRDHASGSVRRVIGQIRDKLALYYAGAGREARVVIDVPVGSYRPRFLTRTVSELFGALSDAGVSIEERWVNANAHDLMRSATPGSTLRIGTTFFIDFWELHRTLREVCGKGCRVEILMMNAENEALIRGRFRLRREPFSMITDQIKQQFDELKAFSETNDSSLEVKATDSMPFGFFVQGESSEGRWMLIGLMPAIEAFTEGPMIKVGPRSERLWRVFEDTWKGVWSDPLDDIVAHPRGVYSDRQMVEVEGTIDATEIWVADPDMLNVTGTRAVFAEVVRRNLERGIRYTYIYPSSQPGVGQLRQLEALAHGHENQLRTVSVPDAAFWELTSAQLPSHFLVCAPREANLAVFMQLPREEGGWIRLDDMRSRFVTHRLAEFVEEKANGFDRLDLIKVAENSERAMSYVTRQLARAHNVLNTHVRFKTARGVGVEGVRYSRQTTDDIGKTMQAFLSKSGNRWTDIIGEGRDDDYIRRVWALLPQDDVWPANHFVKQLDNQPLFMNFLILDYPDTSEVLFGWGRYVLAARETVFSSSSPHVVEVFRDLFNALAGVAKSTSARKIWEDNQNSTEPTLSTRLRGS